MYARLEEKAICGTCGRVLGVGYYWSCRRCRRTFCYCHIPSNPACPHKPHVLTEELA